MLKKLLKYEFKSVSRILLPLYGAVLGLGIVNGLLFNVSMHNETNSVIINSLSGGFISLYALALMGVSIFTLILILTRFFKSMYGTEGYLTHTLPVSSTTHLLNKTISAFVWFLIDALASILSLVVMMLCVAPSDFGNILSEIPRGIKYLAAQIGGWNFFFYMIEFLFAAITCSICSVLMFFTSMSIGQLASKNKILLSIGSYMGISFVMNLIVTIIMSVFFANVFYAGTSSLAILHIGLLAVILIGGILSCVFFFINKEVLDNKLNLE